MQQIGRVCPAFQVQNISRQDQFAVIQFHGAEGFNQLKFMGMMDPPGSSYCIEEKASLIFKEGGVLHDTHLHVVYTVQNIVPHVLNHEQFPIQFGPITV